MSDTRLSQFQNQSYLNLETFRKSGVGVKTPVWFVEDGGVLYVRTIASSGKVKRIRNNSQVRVVPAGGRGEPRGEWVDAHAALADETLSEQVNKLMKPSTACRRTCSKCSVASIKVITPPLPYSSWIPDAHTPCYIDYR